MNNILIITVGKTKKLTNKFLNLFNPYKENINHPLGSSHLHEWISSQDPNS